MSFHRTIIRLSALLASLALGWACGGDSATAPEPARPTTVTVSPATRELTALGTTVQLSAEVRDQNARVMAGATVTWTSSANSVATVDASGLVTVAGNGTATITASVGSASGSAVVTVMQSVASVEVSPSVYELTALGQTVQLTAEAFDENGHAVAGAEFSWESSDAAVATVDAGGLVTAVAEGVATITASGGEASGSAVVPVMQPVASVQVSPSAETIELGSTLQLTAEAFDENGHAVAGAELSWESSDAAVATVDAGGLVTAVAEGVATITASAGSVQGTAEITVGPDLERAALVALYEILDGPNWRNNDNWLTDAPLGEWYGVDVDHDGRVVALRLVHTSQVTETGVRTSSNHLRGPIPAGVLVRFNRLTELTLFGDLTGPIPPELGSLASLRTLSLTGNMVGLIPSELGRLVDLRNLRLRSRTLEGPIPRSLLQISALRTLSLDPTGGLCWPGTVEFVAWMNDTRPGLPWCNQTDMSVLESLYEATGGTSWTGSDGWLGDAALAEWHGVRADALGRVTALNLTGNGLNGSLPPSLGLLAHMTELRIGSNALHGRLPASLVRLRLLELRYTDTQLCVSDDDAIRRWLNAIPSREGPETRCAPLTDRGILEVFYGNAGGSNWTNSRGWLTDAPLENWYGVDIDREGRLSLRLRFNNLSGSIAPELGDLAGLWSLDLSGNDLSGPIPSQLGDLAGLRWLDLSDNRLSGAIPPELGNLSDLRSVRLAKNDLSGPIPRELGRLRDLEALDLQTNALSGSIPPDLGDLDSVQDMRLNQNDLSGPIPPGLGRLSSLSGLYLNQNKLTGPVPEEFGALTRLTRLVLASNPGMSGALPTTLASLGRLEVLIASGTDLCAPSEPAFDEWLESIEDLHVARCAETGGSMAYLTQAVQSAKIPVPQVAEEAALLRVFVTTMRATDLGMPPVRASFHLNGEDAYEVTIPGTSTSIPSKIEEGLLSKSANAQVPDWLIRPGLEMVIDIDPDGTLDPGLGVTKRIPEMGRIKVEVHEMPLLDLTVIPFLWSVDDPNWADLNRAVVEAAEGMAADPEGHVLLWETRTLMPVGDLVVKAHVPVLSSGASVYDVLAQTEAIRVVEGGSGHYLGLIGEPSGIVGLARLGGRVAASEPDGGVIAHELGHNFSLGHARCDNGDGDLSYPHPNGTIGAWGYDSRDDRLVPPTSIDIMTGCVVGRRGWISDYHFTKAFRYRVADEGASGAAAGGASARSLLLWGGVGADGVLFLEPTFVVDAPPALPDSPGEHRLTGWTAGGVELFSLRLAMPEMADGDGSSSFAFVLPVQPGWVDNLASITLSGPGGSTTLDSNTDLPMTILLDPRSGQVRGILRDPPQADAAAALAHQAGLDGLDVLFSRGIPDAAAWRR